MHARSNVIVNTWSNWNTTSLKQVHTLITDILSTLICTKKTSPLGQSWIYSCELNLTLFRHWSPLSLQTSCSSFGPLRCFISLRVFYQKLSLRLTCLNELTARNKDSTQSKATTIAICVALQQLGFTLCTPSLLLLMFLSACVRTCLISLPYQRGRKLNMALAVHCNKIYKKIGKNDPEGHLQLPNITVRRSFPLRKWLPLPRYVVWALLAVKVLCRAIAIREA